jgi:serine/threonine protein kinase
MARFQTEGIAACRVRHPNAVEVYASGFSQGVPYLVMELLTGETLWALLAREAKLPVPRAVEVATPVASALTAAHAARVIHRDVKPDNIFLHHGAEGEVVKVVDFGIARLVDEARPPALANITRAGETIGTPEYMAPERLLGGTYDASADVYALGVVLFRMLTGEKLFDQQETYDGAEMVRLHLTSRPRDLARLAPKVPGSLAELVTSMLAKDPTARPTSREVTEALALLQDQA